MFWRSTQTPPVPPHALSHTPESAVPLLLAATAFALAGAATVSSLAVVHHKLFRVPSAAFVTPTLFGRRLRGVVVSVGDADGVRVWHIPTWRQAVLGSSSVEPPPLGSRELGAKNTISVRLAGVDGPEGAHFGMEEQPYYKEALERVKHLALGQEVSFVPHSKDRYGRVVATVYVPSKVAKMLPKWTPLPPSLKWVSLGRSLVQSGLAAVYREAGAQYGGDKRELERLERAAKRSLKGMWTDGSETVLPSEHKKRFRAEAAVRDDQSEVGGLVVGGFMPQNKKQVNSHKKNIKKTSSVKMVRSALLLPVTLPLWAAELLWTTACSAMYAALYVASRPVVWMSRRGLRRVDSQHHG